jgi:hypothetical protein
MSLVGHSFTANVVDVEVRNVASVGMPSCASMVLDLRRPGVAAASSSRGEQERRGRALCGRGGRWPAAPPRLAPGGPRSGLEGPNLGQVGLGGASASVPSLPWQSPVLGVIPSHRLL